MSTATQIPFVEYLQLNDGAPYLVANECTNCGARFFDHRSACGACSATEFSPVHIDTTGVLKTFTIVAFAAPGVEVPFTAAIVDCGGTTVRGLLVNCPADPEHVKLGMPVRLTTTSMGIDSAGTEAINYAFEPI